MPNKEREEQSGPTYLNKSLDKAFSLLDLFNSRNEKMSMTDISKKTDYNPSSLYPILHTMEKYDYLHRDEDKKYSLGLAFAKKGRLVLENLSLSKKARVELENLRDETNRTIHLGFINEKQLVYIDKVESKGIKLYSSPGKTAPLHATGLGKAILAHLSKERLEEILPALDFSPYTKNTITSREELEQELREVKERGYAIDDEEFEKGVKCIAAPIKEHNGEVRAAISLTGLAAQMDEEVLREQSALVKKYARNISSKLGYDFS